MESTKQSEENTEENTRAWLISRVDAVAVNVDASMTVNEVVAAAFVAGAREALDLVRSHAEPVLGVNDRLLETEGTSVSFQHGYAAGAGLLLNDIDVLTDALTAMASSARLHSMLRHPSHERAAA